MLLKLKEIIDLFEQGILPDNDPNGKDYVRGHNNALNRVIVYIQQVVLNDIKTKYYTWTPIENGEPLSCCILDVRLLDGDVKGLREAYPVYKYSQDNDEWYILFTKTPLKKVAGNYEIVNWMPFPESKI